MYAEDVRKIILYFVKIILAAGLIIYMISLSSDEPQPHSVSVSDGIAIVKYPDNMTAFKFVTADGVTIITDPFNLDETVAADIVTVSHDHGDHNDTSLITGDYSLLTTSGSYDIEGVHIVGFPGVHDKGDYSVTNVIFVFETQGIRIAQFASQGAVPDEETLEQIGDVDILIIQFMDYATKMTAEEACEVATSLHAKIIIPAHGDPTMADDLANLLGCDYEIIESGQIDVTRNDLDNMDRPKVVVLDH